MGSTRYLIDKNKNLGMDRDEPKNIRLNDQMNQHTKNSRQNEQKRAKMFSLPSISLSNGNSKETWFDLASNDTLSNKKGTSTTVEFLDQSDGGFISTANGGGTVVRRLSMHMPSK